jgi:hypothetical protein
VGSHQKEHLVAPAQQQQQQQQHTSRPEHACAELSPPATAT